MTGSRAENKREWEYDRKRRAEENDEVAESRAEKRREWGYDRK